MSCTTPYTDPCGCQFQLDTKCVFYNSDNLTCLEVDSGSDLETILKAIDAKICTLNPDTPIVYNVRNLDGTITVVPTGTNPRVFTVSLSGTFLNRITNIEGDITVIQDFINNLSFATTTPGMTGSVVGNVITVNYTNPTTATKHGGIIHTNNNRTALAPLAPNGTGVTTPNVWAGINLLDTTTYDLKVGEQIILKSTFQIPGRSNYIAITTDYTMVSLSVAGTPGYNLEFQVLGGDEPSYTVRAEAYITCLSLNTGIPNASVTGSIFAFRTPDSTLNNMNPGKVLYPSKSTSDLQTFNWASMIFGTQMANQASSGDAYNFDFSVELIKLF